LPTLSGIIFYGLRGTTEFVRLLYNKNTKNTVLENEKRIIERNTAFQEAQYYDKMS
jgi:hypothetical protein